MKQENYFVYHQAFLRPMLTRIEQQGYSLDRFIKSSMISLFDINNYHGYLPSSILHDFLNVITNEFSIKTLQSDFYKEFPLTDLGPYGELITSSPDLLSVIDQGLKFQHFFQTNQIMKLDIEGALCRFSHTHLDGYSTERCIAQKIGFSMIIKTFKSFLGEDWVPEILQVPQNETMWLESMFDENNIENIIWQTNMPTYAFYFKTELLTQKNPAGPKNPPHLDNPLITVSEKLCGIMKAYKIGLIPTLGDMSTFFDVSVRTIERNLKQEGCTFAKLLEQHLFKKSLDLLGNTHLQVKEISQILGYANPSNFLRAFKSWTCVTPQMYRNQVFS